MHRIATNQREQPTPDVVNISAFLHLSVQLQKVQQMITTSRPLFHPIQTQKPSDTIIIPAHLRSLNASEEEAGKNLPVQTDHPQASC